MWTTHQKSLEHDLVHRVQIHTVRDWRNLSQHVLKFNRLFESVISYYLKNITIQSLSHYSGNISQIKILDNFTFLAF